jgi:hypothetical protein
VTAESPRWAAAGAAARERTSAARTGRRRMGGEWGAR